MIEIVDTDQERIIILKNDSILNSHQFENKLSEFLSDDERDIIIDLNNVTKITSIAIATIIRIKNKLIEDRNRELRLTNANEGITRVLELAGLDSFLLE